jgi:hypothetical protein
MMLGPAFFSTDFFWIGRLSTTPLPAKTLWDALRLDRRYLIDERVSGMVRTEVISGAWCSWSLVASRREKANYNIATGLQGGP